jgi:hypothetical protein
MCVLRELTATLVREPVTPVVDARMKKQRRKKRVLRCFH